MCNIPPPPPMQSNETGSEESQLTYRQQVIRALVQRYIESARREFEETKRKGTYSLSKALPPPHSDQHCNP